MSGRRRARLAAAAVLGVLALPSPAPAAGAKETVSRAVEARGARSAEVARAIWEYAEVGYQEHRSSALLQRELRTAGFTLQSGVAGMPTAFVASTGSGRPVVAILAEFDALPGLSQDAVPERRPLEEGAPGHACGHHLFGAASTAAAVAVKGWLDRSGAPGTLRVYGTPAEEGGSGKVYMTRAGLFDDVDVVLHWHPSDRNQVRASTTLANKSAKFRFRGTPSHAAAAPERGRSALDGVEAMNFMANLLREHVPEETRIHYVITQGGLAPNVVPESAEVFYYVRHPDAGVLAGIWERLEAAARGAAAGTGTEVSWEVIHGNHGILPNETLARAIDANLRAAGGVEYTQDEVAFAEKLRSTLDADEEPLESAGQVRPMELSVRKSSTDVGDVSRVAATGGFATATWVPGTPPHSWQAVAAGGSSIGSKGMLLAARVLAMTAVDLFTDAELVREARAEFARRRGDGFAYVPLLGDREPPLDYRR